MRIDDWRNMPRASISPMYDLEIARWRLGLQWDLQPTLEMIEAARTAGTLPGFVLRGPGQTVVGWTYFVVQDGVAQIGALLARSSEGVRLLLDAVLRAPETSAAREVLVFVFPETSALESALSRRRFEMHRHWFLRRTLGPGVTSGPSSHESLRHLRDADGPDAVRLLAQGYAGSPTARCFAPRGEMEEWARYFAQVSKGQAIGTLMPEATFVSVSPGGRLTGLALATAVAPGTLHLAQLVVAPESRGRGIAGRLLDAVMRTGASHGQGLMTLLVSHDNTVARHLYEARGFLPTGYFLSARRPPLRRAYDLGDSPVRVPGHPR
jgi:ribosomal protein S18 acetylase RimI-like enzyme